MDNTDKLTDFEKDTLIRWFMHNLDMTDRNNLMSDMPILYQKLTGATPSAVLDRVRAAMAADGLPPANTFPTVMDYVRNNQKIQAIKEYRTINSCGLKEAKDAVDVEMPSTQAVRSITYPYDYDGSWRS